MTDRTAPIKFTAATVREVAARVKAFTGGRFDLGATGSDLGNGTRYIDAHTQTVWFGPEGARQACAYYVGAALHTARQEHREIPDGDAEYFLRVQGAYMEGSQRHKRDMMSWEEQAVQRVEALIETGADKNGAE